MGPKARVLMLLGTVGVVAGGSVEAQASQPQIQADHRPSSIYGGSVVQTCGWPTTVSMQGSCTGTLVHPELVIYAAHCGQGFSQVLLTDDFDGQSRAVPTEFCRTYPGGGTGGGTDFAFCKLAQPVDDVPIVPPLMGCETSVLQPGREVVVVGFGDADDNFGYGPKREVTTTLNQITPDNEAFIGGGGKDSCQGDSGGPVYVRLSSQEGGDDTWRVFGITSYGGQCGQGGYYSMMHIGMEWFETESGVDITPCHDADGTWNPGTECFGFPKDPAAGGGDWAEGCQGGAQGSYSSVCGPPFNAEPDEDAPLVTVTEPVDQMRFDSDPASGNAAITVRVDADDGEGWGIREVRLVIDGQEVAGGVDNVAPYEFTANFPAGQFRISAIAIDHADNQGMAEDIRIGVDMDAETPPPPDSGSDSGDGDGGSGADDGDGEGGTAADDSGGAVDSGGVDGSGPGQDEPDPSGCACGVTRSDPSGFVGLLALGLLGLVRRRRAA